MSDLPKNNWLWENISPNLFKLTKAGIAVFISNCLGIFISLFVMVVYNKVIPNSALNTLLTLGLGVAALAVFDFMFKFVKTRLLDEVCENIDKNLSPKLYKKIISWDIQDTPKSVGQSAAISRDLESIIELFANSTVTTVVSLPFIFINLLVIFLIANKLVLVSTVAIIVIFMTSFLGSKNYMRLATKQKQISIEKNGFFLETISNLETLKSIGDYSNFENRWTDSSSQQREMSSSLKKSNNDTSSLNSFWVSFSQICVVAYGAYLASSGDISSGALIGCVLLHGKTIQPVMQLSGVMQRVGAATISYARLNEVFNKNSREEERRKNIRLLELSERITVSNLEFQPEQSPSPTLKIERLRVDFGEKIGILGSVGSGKSTLLKLFAGIYTPTKGQILFGNYDLSALNQSDLRRNVSYLGQHPGLFGGTIQENLTISGGDLTDEQILHISEISGLSEVLKGLPNGLSFKLSENGKELSGGQRQILALARAFASNPNYLLLDEPTSAMDPKSERIFVNRMKNYSQEKTLLVVTHRRPILALTNRIMVVENGRVALDGPRDDILKKISS